MRLNHFSFFLLVGGAFLLAGSCALVIVPSHQAGTSWSGQVFYDRTFALEPGGRVDFLAEVQEVSLEIKGQKKEELRVIASRSLPFSPRGTIILGGRRDLPRVETETRGSSIYIQTRKGKETIFPVKIEMRVPKKVELNQVRINDGDIFVHDLFGLLVVRAERAMLRIINFSGSVDASVEAGNIVAEVLDLRGEDEVDLRATEGDIELSLEPDAEATIQATVSDGRIISDFPCDSEPGSQLDLRLGGGKARIKLRALKGNIRLKKIG
ncbi:MAG: hypothetical protein ACUVR0_00230 [Candidatus Aminicenantales bacterium]